MKRSVLILLSSLLILLAACRSAPPAVEESFEADIAVRGGFDCTARLSRTPDSVTIEMTSPPSVAGIRYVFAHGELTTSLGDLSCITDADSLPASSLPELLWTVLSRISDAAYASSDESGEHYRLSTGSGEAQIICRGGVPHMLTFDGSPYTVTFTQKAPSS